MTLTTKELLRFIALGVCYGINGIVYYAIPIIFYRPYFQCENYDFQNEKTLNQFQCSEFQACNIINSSNQISQNIYQNYATPDNYYQIFQVSEYPQLQSIPMDFNLFCDRKVQEANLLSLGMIGQLLGALIALFLPIKPSKMHRAIYITLLVNMVCLFYTNIAQNLLEMNIIFLGMNIVQSFYQCILYIHINQIFSPYIQEYGPFIMNCLWCSVSILYIILSMFVGNWRTNVGLVMAPISSVLVGTIFLTKLQPRNLQSTDEYLNLNCQIDQTSEINSNTQISPIHDFKTKIKEIRQNRPLMINICLWNICHICAQVCYYMCIIVLNTLLGDLYFNTLGTSILELLANLFSGYLIFNIKDKKQLLVHIFWIMGISFSIGILTTGSQDNSNDKNTNNYFFNFMKMVPVIVGKGTHDVLWSVLYSYIQKVVPQNYQQFTISTANFLSLLGCILLPYYKFIMEYLNLNYFIIIGIICFITAYKSRFFQELDTLNDQNQDIPLVDITFDKNKKKIQIELA